MYARHAESLAPDALIAMPPTAGTSMDDYRAYFRALGQATNRPVIIQTSQALCAPTGQGLKVVTTQTRVTAT